MIFGYHQDHPTPLSLSCTHTHVFVSVVLPHMSLSLWYCLTRLCLCGTATYDFMWYCHTWLYVVPPHTSLSLPTCSRFLKSGHYSLLVIDFQWFICGATASAVISPGTLPTVWPEAARAISLCWILVKSIIYFRNPTEGYSETSVRKLWTNFTTVRLTLAVNQNINNKRLPQVLRKCIQQQKTDKHCPPPPNTHTHMHTPTSKINK